MTTNVVIFTAAAFFEISGCFAFWMSLRRGATPLLAGLGVVSLAAFAFALTRVDSAFAGRAYAEYDSGRPSPPRAAMSQVPQRSWCRT